MRGLDLHTVCEEAMCPNIGECWEEREATFLILGRQVHAPLRVLRRDDGASPTRSTRTSPPRSPTPCAQMGLRFVVLTGVARDDLPDGGARIWAATIRAVREAVPGCGVEVLPTDFKGGERDIATVIEAEPDVFAHNLETVRRLHGRIRPAFGYDRSLEVLRIAKRLRAGQVTKSNLILGMGETPDGGRRGAAPTCATPACDIVTMGQYLQPTKLHLPVDRWVHARRVRRAQARRARRSASRTSRPGRSSGARTTPASSSSGRRACAGRRPRTTSTGVEEPACKPDPVRRPRGRPATISLGARAPRRPFAGAVRPTRELGRAVLERSLLGLAPGGACRAGAVARAAGELLPHRFTLTSRDGSRDGGLLLCCAFREVAPAWVSPAPCPAESGLSSTDPKIDRGRPAGSSVREHTAAADRQTGRTAA